MSETLKLEQKTKEEEAKREDKLKKRRIYRILPNLKEIQKEELNNLAIIEEKKQVTRKQKA